MTEALRPQDQRPFERLTLAVSNVRGGPRTSRRRAQGRASVEDGATMSHIQDPEPLSEVSRTLASNDISPQMATPLLLADRSCCCSAPPAFTVIVPSKQPKAHSVDLLMCGHHYRQSRHVLAELGALVFASDGHLV